MSARSLKSTKDYALAYTQLGFHVFPVHAAIRDKDKLACSCGKPNCSSPAKHPVARLAPKGLNNASTDTAVIKKWFSGLAQYNIGIATGKISGIVVLDVDVRHDGDKSLQELEAKHSPLPSTLRWQSGGGGEHILFRYPDASVSNSVRLIGDGLDVRGDGGYIVAPPSSHISGGVYRLMAGQTLNTPLAELPPWLLRFMQRDGAKFSTTNKPPIASLVQQQVPEGQRNDTIARISGHLLAKRVDPRICLDLMLAFNDARCKPPLPSKEVARTVASIDHLAFTKLINKR